MKLKYRVAALVISGILNIPTFADCAGAPDGEIDQLGKVALGAKYNGYSFDYLCRYSDATLRSRPDLPYYHAGIDFRASYVPTYSIVDGTVKAIENSREGMVIIEAKYNGQNVYVIYYHMSNVLVKAGQQVSRGTQVGITGERNSPGAPHLHLEVRTAYTGHAFGLTSCPDGKCDTQAEVANLTVNPKSLVKAVPTINAVSVSPSSVILNKPITVTVTGKNLPSTLAFWIDSCANLTKLPGSTSTQQQWTCTPSYGTGMKALVVSDKPGGTVLYSSNINVSGLDLNSYCQTTFGSSFSAKLGGKTVNDWKCVLGTQTRNMDLNTACKTQYGTNYQAAYSNFNDPNSWYCKSSTVIDKVSPIDYPNGPKTTGFARLNTTSYFEVSGKNLTNSVKFWIDSCENVVMDSKTTSDSTKRFFKCVPTKAGIVDGSVVDVPNGTVRLNFKVQVVN